MGYHSYNVTRRRGLGFIVFLTVMLFCFGPQASAQTPQYSYGLATGGNAIPWNPISTTYQKWQGFYSAGMFTGAYAGNITKVYFQRYSASSGTTYSNFSISIGQSSSTTFSTGQWFTPMTTALSAATYTIPAGAANAWFEIQLSTPVYYNPNQALIIQVCSSGLSAGSGITIRDGGSMTSPNVGRLYGGPGCTAATPSGYTASYRQNFGFDLSPALPDDAGISALTSPVNFCAGQQDIKVMLRNYGTNTLSNVTVNWTYDGVPETPIAYNTPLPTLGEVELTLGSKSIAAGTPHTIVAWTSSPNSIQDSFTANDTLSRTVQAAISGTYTIGGTSPDFTTFTQAVNTINQFGVCGPVVFNVRPGTYNEQVALNEVPGTSAVNTVTFQSETGNRADVTLTNNATSTANNYVLQMGGADFITFRNMTLTSTGTSYGIVLDISGGAENNLFENLDLIASQTTTTSSYMAVVYSPSGSLDHNNTFLGCNFRNGSFGMYMYGAGTTTTENGLHVEGCEYTGQYYYPMYFYYMGEVEFFGNRVIKDYGYQYYYSMLMYYGFNSKIERNTFITDGGTYCYGFMMYYDNYYQAGTSRVVNNFFTGRNASTYAYYAARIYYCNDLLFAHNTVYLDGTYASGYALYSYYGSNQRYLNNIIKHNGAGRAWYVPSPTAIVESDYNNIVAAGPVLAYWSGDRANLLALQTASGMDAASVSKDVTFLDYTSGDLHLAAPSDDDNDLIGTLLSEVTDDIDNDPRVRPYMGADEACYLIPNSLQYEFVDGGGQPIGYAEIPGTVGVHYTVIFPDFDATIQMTANFYSVPGNQLMYTQSFSAAKLAGQTLDGTSYFNIPSNMPVGFYRIELVFNTKNSCGYYRDYMPYPSSLMLIGQGSTPCEVWPGDVNNDGLVNYTDRKDLNLYIYDANLNTLWLNGPARYRADAAQNPLTYLMWQPQASVPWYTTMGCYMDADGNGVVNNFDYIAIKLNWNRSHGAITPKHTDQFQPTTFDMTQNYPNPFNPTTQIEYSVPERTQVQLRIVDMLGREIAMPVNGIVEAGVYKVEFDGSSLPSGQYLAIVSMTGQETGLGFNKTVKMVLNK